MTSYFASGWTLLKDLCSMYAPKTQTHGRRRAGQSRHGMRQPNDDPRQPSRQPQQGRPTGRGISSSVAACLASAPEQKGMLRRLWEILAASVSFGSRGPSNYRKQKFSTSQRAERQRSQMRTLEAALDDIKIEIQTMKKRNEKKKVRICSPATEPKQLGFNSALSPMLTKSIVEGVERFQPPGENLSFLEDTKTFFLVKKPLEFVVDA